MRKIDLIVIHCSATPDGRPHTVRDVDAWHRQRGFYRAIEARQRWLPELVSIGYHYVIGVDGTIWPARSLDEVGAHAKGHNGTSLGICLIGTDRFTPAQWTSLKMTVEILRRKFEDAAVVGHRDLPDVHKLCPGFDAMAWVSAGMQPLAGHTQA